MINRFLKWLFRLDRPVIRCRISGRPLRSEASRLRGICPGCERKEKAIADKRSEAVITKNMEEIAKELQPNAE